MKLDKNDPRFEDIKEVSIFGDLLCKKTGEVLRKWRTVPLYLIVSLDTEQKYVEVEVPRQANILSVDSVNPDEDQYFHTGTFQTEVKRLYGEQVKVTFNS